MQRKASSDSGSVLQSPPHLFETLRVKLLVEDALLDPKSRMNSSRVDPSLYCKPLRIGSESIDVLGCIAVAALWDRKQERNHCWFYCVVSRDSSAEHGRHCGRNQQCITFWQSFSASISLCGNDLDCFLTAHTQACTADARGGVTQGTSEHVTQCCRDTEVIHSARASGEHDVLAAQTRHLS